MPRCSAAARSRVVEKDREELSMTSLVPLRYTIRHKQISFTTLLSHYFCFSSMELDIGIYIEPIQQQQL